MRDSDQTTAPKSKLALLAWLLVVQWFIGVTLAVAQSNNAAAYTWTTSAGYPGAGAADGVGGAAQFDLPRSTAVDSAGNVYVVDSGNHTIRKITPARLVSTNTIASTGFNSVLLIPQTNLPAAFCRAVLLP